VNEPAVTRLEVRLERTPTQVELIGRLALFRGQVLCELTTSFLAGTRSISPFKLVMQPGVQTGPGELRHGLHGVFDDSLPDGWGLLLMDRVFRARGLAPDRLSALDRLAYLGRRTLGALTYHPCTETDLDEVEVVKLGELASAALGVYEGSAAEVLPALQRAGGSPGGARPKVLVGVRGDKFISGADDLPIGYRPWLIKFNTRDEPADAGALEYAYARMARSSGVTTPEPRLFELPGGERCFGVRRFDRDDGGRVHMHTLANLLHVDYRTPSLDYEHLIRVTMQLTKDHRHVRECFRRALFNWLAHNRDDHGKNFAFLMRDDGAWELSPAYDLTFSGGPGGEHTMTYAGQGKRPRWSDLQRLARLASIDAADALQILGEVRAGVGSWTTEAQALQLPRAQIQEIAGRLAEVEAAGELPPRTPAPTRRKGRP